MVEQGMLDFREVQRIRQTWIWLIVGGVSIFIWYMFIRQILFGHPVGTRPGPDWMAWLLWIGFGIVLPAFFFVNYLAVEVGERGIRIRYFPIVNRFIPFSQIKQYEARSYRPIKEYGGWGIKGWSSRNMAYNVSGNRGVELQLLDGRTIMIGSQRAEELAQAIALHCPQAGV